MSGHGCARNFERVGRVGDTNRVGRTCKEKSDERAREVGIYREEKNWSRRVGE